MEIFIIKYNLGAARLSYHSPSGLFLFIVGMIICIASCESDDVVPSTPDSSISPTANTTTTTAKASTATAISQVPLEYDAYLEGITGLLGPDDLEYGLDYYSEKPLLNEFNFDPMKIVKVLIDRAAAQNTTPEQFLADMQDLVYLQNRSRSEAKDGLSGSTWEDSAVFRSLGIGQGEGFRENWKNELKRLEKKYKVSSEYSEPELAVTAGRLALMFPHYLNIGQKPFSSPWDVQSDPNGYCQVPSFFQRPEFGGIIPRSGILGKAVKLSIFTVHLQTMYRGEKENALPFRTKCVMVKRRMETSLLSDDRRVRFLENNNVITKDGDLTYAIKSAYDDISSEFKEKVYLPQTHSSYSARRAARDRYYHASSSTTLNTPYY